MKMRNLIRLFIVLGIGVIFDLQTNASPQKGEGGGNTYKADNIRAKAEFALQRCLAKIFVQNPPPPPQGATQKQSTPSNYTKGASAKGK